MFYQNFAKSITNIINLLTKNTLKGNEFRTVCYLSEKGKHIFFILNLSKNLLTVKQAENILHKNL